MNKSFLNVYQLVDNGEVKFEGTSPQLAERFGLSRCAISNACLNKWKINGRYDVLLKNQGEEVFRITDLDGNFIAIGKSKDISRMLGIGGKTLYNSYYSKRPLLKKYRVERLVIQCNQTTLGYLIRHLDQYGNTILDTNPEQYLPQLEERYKAKIKVTKSHNKGWILSL